MKDKLIFPVVGILCATLLILPAVLLGYNLGKGAEVPMIESLPEATATADNRAAKTPESTTIPLQTSAPNSERAITIPGFERVQLAATPASQSVPFYNPESNKCYFVISLLLPGGEEIYRSALIAPGETQDTAALSYIPKAGIYENTVLRYSCYSLEGYEVMNGADVDIILEIT